MIKQSKILLATSSLVFFCGMNTTMAAGTIYNKINDVKKNIKIHDYFDEAFSVDASNERLSRMLNNTLNKNTSSLSKSAQNFNISHEAGKVIFTPKYEYEESVYKTSENFNIQNILELIEEDSQLNPKGVFKISIYGDEEHEKFAEFQRNNHYTSEKFKLIEDYTIESEIEYEDNRVEIIQEPVREYIKGNWRENIESGSFVSINNNTRLKNIIKHSNKLIECGDEPYGIFLSVKGVELANRLENPNYEYREDLFATINNEPYFTFVIGKPGDVKVENNTISSSIREIDKIYSVLVQNKITSEHNPQAGFMITLYGEEVEKAFTETPLTNDYILHSSQNEGDEKVTFMIKNLDFDEVLEENNLQQYQENLEEVDQLVNELRLESQELNHEREENIEVGENIQINFAQETVEEINQLLDNASEQNNIIIEEAENALEQFNVELEELDRRFENLELEFEEIQEVLEPELEQESEAKPSYVYHSTNTDSSQTSKPETTSLSNDQNFAVAQEPVFSAQLIESMLDDGSINQLSAQEKASLYEKIAVNYGASTERTMQAHFDQTMQLPEVGSLVENIVNSATSIRLGAIGVAAGDEEESKVAKGLWIKGLYGKQQQKSSKNLAGYSGTSYGAIVGGDLEFDNNLVLGIAASNIKSNFKYTGKKSGDQAKANSFGITVYGSKDIANNLFLNGSFSAFYTDVNVKLQKKINNNVLKYAKAKFKSFGNALDLGLSYVKKFENGMSLVPNIGIKYASNSDSYFEETGAGLFNVTISGKKSQTLTAKAGGTVNFNSFNAGNTQIIPSLSMNVNHQLLSKSDKVTAKLKWQDKEYQKEMKLPSQRNTNISISPTVTIRSGTVDLSANYDFTAGKNFHSHSGSLKLRVNF